MKTPEGLVAFGRDLESSRQVWSSQGGYPGDADYREFYRDLGYDGQYESLRPYLHADGVRRNLGIKYHRVTGPGDLGQRALYHRERALAKAENTRSILFRAAWNKQPTCGRLCASHQLSSRLTTPNSSAIGGLKVPTSWIRSIRKTASSQSQFKLATLSDVLETIPQPSLPATSSVFVGRAGLSAGVAQRANAVAVSSSASSGTLHGGACKQFPKRRRPAAKGVKPGCSGTIAGAKQRLAIPHQPADGCAVCDAPL